MHFSALERGGCEHVTSCMALYCFIYMVFRSTLTGLSANPYQYGGWSLLKDASPQNGWAGLNGYSDCRGHFGGLLGGALTAYLLGPRLERVKRKGGHTLQDNPPIPLFASKL